MQRAELHMLIIAYKLHDTLLASSTFHCDMRKIVPHFLPFT
ncbi:hypothetical protein XBJ2_1840010 [Xenorhabdus bovienii str. Jollieti]|uniref:Uncharacterized protein n=1 Tax=Xenorhabdus bovienii (strain SS-2004) TaxID=406818 RepID=D3V4W5_XENBS|nr:hypothetical protein XBJ1_3576 [Xenorhabdus bovienii SS-2004]CDH28486.1 hypothetical protein XBJ2_1840010 [Xenorhabdus bovienii str. Jollieti]